MSVYRKYEYAQVDRKKYRPLKRIQFKKISDDPDFDRGVYNVTYKNLTTPDENGYLTDVILSTVKSDAKTYLNIINVGVGQGKTTAMYKLIRQYYDEGYKVIVASPYHTLVEKDYHSVINGNPSVGIQPIDTTAVFKFIESNEKEKEKDDKKDTMEIIQNPAEKDIHIMTINMLLGNAGSDNLRQAENKRIYLSKLQKEWTDQGRKVVIIFDEIHESIHNFKPELIYNLYGWSGMLHQCFFVTATITEPVKFVAYHVATLTDFNIRVMEADRILLPPARYASLDLYVASSSYAKGNLDELSFIFDYMDEFETPVTHVLCYSKKLARKLSKEFKERGLEHNLIVGSNKATASFDSRKSTISTTLKTGIDITDPDQLYVVILPPAPWKSDSVSNISGIFSDGIPAIVQSLARKRNGGKILVVLPQPKKILKDSKMNLEYLIKNVPNFIGDDDIVSQPESTELEILSGYWMGETLRIRKWQNEYQMMQKSGTTKMRIAEDKRKEDKKNKEGQTLKAQFDRIFRDVKEEEDLTEELKQLFNHQPLIDSQPIPHLHFPSFEEFVISNGQEFISNYSEWYGKHIVPYFLWAALNDQFQNCQLDTIFSSKREFHTFNIETSDVGASIYNFCLGIGENPYPEDDERYILKWEKLYKRLQNKSVVGVKQITNVIVDGKSRDSYVNGSEFKQAFLGLYFEDVGRNRENFDFAGYVIHQMQCSNQRKFKHNRQLEKAYLELHESLEAIANKISKVFPDWIPYKSNEADISYDLHPIFRRLRKALEHLWKTDSFLMEKTWNVPTAVKHYNLDGLWKFWRTKFVIGNEGKETVDRGRIQVLRNYQFRHRILPENYSDFLPIY